MIEALQLNAGTMNRKTTPAKAKLSVRDTDAEVAGGDFSYSSVFGMVLYLSGCPLDIAYAVNCAACYVFCPRHSHEYAIKRIKVYLKATCSREFILNPSSNLKIDCYPDVLLESMDTRKQVIQLM